MNKSCDDRWRALCRLPHSHINLVIFIQICDGVKRRRVSLLILLQSLNIHQDNSRFFFFFYLAAIKNDPLGLALASRKQTISSD